MRMKEAELLRLFSDKIVVIGDNRLTSTRRPDHNVMAARDGTRVVFNCYMHAMTISNMLESRIMHYAQPSIQFGALLLVGIVGTSIGRILYSSSYRWLRCSLWAILSTLVVVVAFNLAAEYQLLLSPSGAILAIGLTIAGAAWIGRVWAAGGRRAVE